MQFDQADVDSRGDFESSNAYTVVEHLVGRLGVSCQLITPERFQVPANLPVHKRSHISEATFAHLLKDQALHHVRHMPLCETLRDLVHAPVILIHPRAAGRVPG